MNGTENSDAPQKGMIMVSVKGPKGGDLFKGEVRASMKVGEFKKHFLQRSKNAKHKKLHYTRARLTSGEDKAKIALTDNTKTLAFVFGKETLNIDLCFKDLGPQISWTTVFLVEYAGPILITLFLVYFQKAIYGKTYDFNLNQKLGILMNILHYMKREYETIYVHRFSAETMPWTNIIKNSTHYWVINGLLGMYFFLRPDYTAPAWLSAEGSYVIFALFCFCELMNLMCHGVLRDLRKPGTTTRGIPHGFGFDQVACANYFWESMCWLLFAIQGQVIGAYIFYIFSTVQMAQWAMKKHQRYRKEFPDDYKVRRAMFPFIF